MPTVTTLYPSGDSEITTIYPTVNGGETDLSATNALYADTLAARDEALAAQAAAEAAAALVGTVIVRADTLAGLKAFDTGSITSAYQTYSGLQGQYNFTSGDYSALIDNYAYVAADDTASTLGAWVRKFERPPIPEDFGGTDYASVNRCAVYAVRETGEMGFSPTTYTLNTDLSITDSLEMRGVPGKTVLDFSSRTGFANGSTSGLIKPAGSIASAILLTQSVRPRQSSVPVAAVGKANRTGTSLEFETDFPHGLSVGDPVWAIGGGTTTTVGQQVFYTVNTAAGSANFTTPFIVATVSSSVKFTVTVANTGDLTNTEQINIIYAADVLLLASTSGLAAGDIVKLKSNDKRWEGGSTYVDIGEFQTIARILGGGLNGVQLHSEVRDTYTTGNSAAVAKTTLITPSFSGITVKGNGPNTGSGYGDRGIYMNLVKQAKIDQCSFVDVDQMCVQFRNTVGGEVRNSLFASNATDEAGWSSGALDIQYGVALDGACEGVLVAGNVFNGFRHAIDQTSTTVSSDLAGVSRDCSIVGNEFKGAWLGAIATHQAVGRWTISNNTFSGVHVCVNIRYAEEVIIANNIGQAYESAVHIYNANKSALIDGNILKGGSYGVRVGEELTAGDKGYIEISNNSIEAELPVYIYDAQANATAHIKVVNNNLRECGITGIRIGIGDGSTGGWSGSIARNSIKGVSGIAARSPAIWLSNARDVDVADNEADANGTAFTRVVYFDGNRTYRPRERHSKNIGLAPTIAIASAASGITSGRLQSVEEGIVNKSADFTCDYNGTYRNNKLGSSCTVTLPDPTECLDRTITIINEQAQTVVSASSNVVPLAGGAAGTAILAATAGKFAVLKSNGTNWRIINAN